MTVSTKHTYLHKGPIPKEKLLFFISPSDGKTGGAEALFLGIIRDDKLEDKKVEAIDYSAYLPMAEKVFRNIENEVLQQFDILQLSMIHSLGLVKAGEISMLVCVRSLHREQAFLALRETVERIKAHAPVWKQEYYEDGSCRWV